MLKKRNKDDVALRDNGDNKRSGKVSLVERRHKDYSTERTPSVKDSCRLADNAELEEQNHGMCSNEATTGLEKDDRMDSGLPRSLPGMLFSSSLHFAFPPVDIHELDIQSIYRIH